MSDPITSFGIDYTSRLRRLPPPLPGLLEGKVCTEIAEECERRRERD